MSAGSPTFTVSRLAALSLVSLWLAGCSSSNNAPAPVSSVGGQSSSGSGMLITPSQRTGATGQQAQPVPVQPQIQPRQVQPQIQPRTQPQAQVQSQPVQTVNGRIVYNRKYGDIPKGSYTGNTYTVKRGDTLFYIAWVTGNDFRDLAQRNNIPEPYGLNVGQTLQVGNGSGQPITGDNAVAQASATAARTEEKSYPVVASQPTITYSEDSGENSANKMLPNNKPVAPVTAPVTAPVVASTTQPTASSSSTSTPISSWRWPTDGKIIEGFSGADGGNKGVDIAGSKGQAIVATASGRVVYAGNALRGYGNLIIIKHSDDYLSAYAHNDTMLVREQQEVAAGQKIATMGSTGTSSTRLHFEIRYKGKSVNPLQYLPQR